MTTTQNTVTDRLAAIEARRAEISTGNWMRLHTGPWKTDPSVVVLEANHALVADNVIDDDADFIAHAPTDIDWLIAELKAARTELQRIADCEPVHKARIRAVLGTAPREESQHGV